MPEQSRVWVGTITVSMPQGTIAKAAIYTALILLANSVIILATSVALSQNLLPNFTLLLLLEAAVLLFTGGFKRTQIVTPGLVPTSRRDWSLIITGLFVLALSFLLAYPLEWVR